MTFIGLIALNGLMSSIRFECKFKMKQEDHVAWHYLFVRIFGDSASRCWKEFKLNFSLFGPRATPPSKKVSPNCKVQEFLNHMHDANNEAWVLCKTCLNHLM